MQNLEFRDMNIDEVLLMRSWGVNSNPLLKSYDFWPRTEEECKYWHYEKTKDFRNKYFVYMYEKDVICYISIKNIKKNYNSTLGIVMDPRYQDRGVGSFILKDFIKKYKKMGFKKMELKVDLFNKRAIHLYKKLGFVTRAKTISIFDGKREDISPNMRKYFFIAPGIILSKCLIMEVRL